MNNPKWTVRRWYKRLRILYLVHRDGPLCRYCGCRMDRGSVYRGPESRRLTLDHIVPKSRGGTNSLDNLGLACATCNTRKGSQSESQFRLDVRLLRRRESIANEHRS